MEEKILKYYVIEFEDNLYKLDALNTQVVLGNIINTQFGYYEILGIVNGVGITKIKQTINLIE